MNETSLSDDQTRRYSRHILLPEIDIEGQTRLLNSKILIVGAGGLGCPAALYLAASGVGQITIADFDRIELSNLQRQIAFGHQDIGRLKSAQLGDALTTLNPDVRALALNSRLAGDKLNDAVARAHAVIDASDNFETRFAVNAACRHSETPLISGSASRYHGQLSVFDFRRPQSPCYHCLFGQDNHDDTRADCQELGVFAPLTGVIGCYLAAETIKVLLNIGDTLTGRLATFDILRMSMHTATLRRDPLCPTCGEAVPS